MKSTKLIVALIASLLFHFVIIAALWPLMSVSTTRSATAIQAKLVLQKAQARGGELKKTLNKNPINQVTVSAPTVITKPVKPTRSKRKTEQKPEANNVKETSTKTSISSEALQLNYGLLLDNLRAKNDQENIIALTNSHNNCLLPETKNASFFCQKGNQRITNYLLDKNFSQQNIPNFLKIAADNEATIRKRCRDNQSGSVDLQCLYLFVSKMF